MAEHYRRVISEKTRDALARLRANGRRMKSLRPLRLHPGGRRLPAPRPEGGGYAAGDQRARDARAVVPRTITRACCSRVVARNGRPFAASTLRVLLNGRRWRTPDS